VSFAADMKKKVYVAAVKKAELQMIVDVMNDVGLNLQHIDITELALRNINALYGDDQCYLGLLAFQHDCIEFIITSHHHLLLSRRLALPQNIHTNEIPSQWLSDLIVEIHNSFTYCNSQQRSEVPNKLLVLTSTASLISQLGQSLNIETRPLTLEKKINLDFIMPSDDYLSLHYLIAIGGALRGKYDVAGH